MAERRHHIITVVASDGAEDVARIACHGVRAFDEREIAGMAARNSVSKLARA